MKAQSPGMWINELFPKSPTDRQFEECFNIWFRVVLSWFPARHERFEFERQIGAGQIDNLLSHQPLNMGAETKGGGSHIAFFFPENHMTVQEEYVFVPILKEHPDIVSRKMVIIDIVTTSALIVGNFISDDVRIMKPENGSPYPDDIVLPTSKIADVDSLLQRRDELVEAG